MNIQDLRDIVAQINAAHPTENSEFPVLLEGKGSWFKVTFMSCDGIKIQLRYEYNHEQEWAAIALFYELSDLAWHFSKRHPDNALVSIIPDNGKLKATCEEEESRLGGIEEELVEESFQLFFDEDEFEAYHECVISSCDWHHLQSAALIARQNTTSNKNKYPALCGINVAVVNQSIELSAMCPTATTHHLICNENPVQESFSFTIPVELVDCITQSVNASAIDSIIFSVNPELILVRLGIQGQVNAHLLIVEPIKGRYWYPKVPTNQITEKSVIVSKQLLQEALSSATKAVGDYTNEVLLQVQDEQLFVHGRASSFQIDAADCAGVKDNEIRICGIRLLDMIKYIPDGVGLFLDFPEKTTQALMIGTCHGIQYLVFGLVKGDRVLSPDLNITETLLTIPGIIPGEPDLVVELTEQPILDPPLPENVICDLKNELMQTYGLCEDWEFAAKIDELIEGFIEARSIVEAVSPSPEIKPLLASINEILDDHEYAIAQYESGDGDLYYHGGLCAKDLQEEVEAIKDMITSTNLLAGRVKEVSLKLEKTYSVRMTFA